VNPIIPLLLLTAVFSVATWLIDRSRQQTIEYLRADNKDLRDRLFIKHQLPPSNIDLTQRHEERQEQMKIERGDSNGKNQHPVNPLKTWTQEMTQKDLKEQAASRR